MPNCLRIPANVAGYLRYNEAHAKRRNNGGKGGDYPNHKILPFEMTSYNECHTRYESFITATSNDLGCFTSDTGDLCAGTDLRQLTRRQTSVCRSRSHRRTYSNGGWIPFSLIANVTTHGEFENRAKDRTNRQG